MKRIGIDAGGTLTKIAYEEDGRLHVKTYGNQEMEKLMQWLNNITPNAVLHITGGKSRQLATIANHKQRQADEFQAIVEGTRYLLGEESHLSINNYILVSIGTGTSIFHVTQSHFERVTGSGIGGGTLIGLGSLITGKKEFKELVTAAANGNHENSDLLVKDIYAPEKPPLFGELTAANFGKAHLHDLATSDDHMAALMQLIAESTILLATQAAAMKNAQKIVFVGSTLNGNQPLKDVLSSFQNIMLYEPVFLDKGAYAGAIGALIS
ncbi:type II pantothenate kinase [Oceanobacillus saliphilus]|uniref:type II pantothenate kinase n=1 Tax=Oceanobacillus saliphilus TaxID=2925834 RepID=UPI00201DC071|nr:type II pantothenate kinase [Oceanobacillus saliphilus]